MWCISKYWAIDSLLGYWCGLYTVLTINNSDALFIYLFFKIFLCWSTDEPCWSWQKRSDEEVAKIYIWWGENFGGEKLFLHLQSFKLFIMCVCMFVNVFSFESKVFLVTNKGLLMVGCHKTNKKNIMVCIYK